VVEGNRLPLGEGDVAIVDGPTHELGGSSSLFALDEYNNGGAPSHGKEDVTIVLGHLIQQLAWASMSIFPH
jgi:hypothetical protein